MSGVCPTCNRRLGGTLTARQHEVLDAIQQFSRDHGRAPIYAELAAILGVTSMATVHGHVNKLIAKGYLADVKNKRPAIVLLEGA